MPDEHERLQRSWIANANAWRDAVREHRIESRRLVTDAAILEAVLALHPRRVLDLGCGEGWLTRALASHGIDVTGIDASAPLIDAARALGGGTFHVMRYEDAAQLGVAFDVTVANFALLDDRTADVLRGLDTESLVVQTVCLDDEEGWRTETFAAFPGEWPEAMPWYHRPRAAWLRLFEEAGFASIETRDTTRSLLFVFKRHRRATG